MARRPRIDLPGYHHIVNRGVDRMDVFRGDEDKEAFLRIVCKACRVYGVVLHDYVLMDNHYHLLIENSQENLSLFMRQINANYAIYFNKKSRRTGHLWQGRYRSWFIVTEDHLYQTIRYIAYNPIEAHITENIRDYPHALSSKILRGEKLPPCAGDSLLIKQYDPRTLAAFLDEPMSHEEISRLEQERRKKVIRDEKGVRHEEKRPLVSYFTDIGDKSDRNEAVFRAYMDGHTQRSIAHYLGLSDAMISIIVKKFKI